MTHRTNTNSQGFTLIELLVVISIIGLLSSVVVGSLSSAKKKAEGAKIVQNMNQLKIALELYKNDHGEYPNEGVADCKSSVPSGKCMNTDFVSYLNSELVNNKYIGSIPNPATIHPSFYGYAPIAYVTGSINAYGVMYLYDINENFEISLTCGGKKLKGYLLEFYNDQVLSFPKVGVCLENDDILEQCHDLEDVFLAATESNDHWYCIGE